MASIFLALLTVLAADPVQLTPAGRDSLRKNVGTYRKETQDWLKSAPTSYLAAVRREDFGRRPSLTVGREAHNDVRIEDPAISPVHLRVTVVGDSFRVEALDPEATFQIRDSVMREATLPPGGIQLGRYHMRLSHQNYPAIIVFDPQSPQLKKYKGMRFYSFDPKLRFVVPLTPDPHPDTSVVLSTRGTPRAAVRAGWFEVKIRGVDCRLAAMRLLEPGMGEEDLAIFFRDETSGKDTYPVGRYLDPQRLGDGRYVVDFNLAYNPACAYSPHYNCPIPPVENTLDVPVRAGEKDAHYDLDSAPRR